MEEKDTREIFNIDEDNLVEELKNQPKFYYDYASQLAVARRRVEEEKATLDVIEANLKKEIREDPEKFELKPNPAIAIVDGEVMLQKPFQNARQIVIKLKYKMDMIQAAVIALDHRKSALERMVSLHGQNYFSTPVISGEGKDNVEEQIKRSVRTKRVRRHKD